MKRTIRHTERFERRAQLGSGTFGTVYEAFDHERGHLVALKHLHKVSPDTLFRFKKEFRLLANFSHHNLVSLYELFETNGQWFFSMELVRGSNLIEHLRETIDQSRSPTNGDASINVHAGTLIADSQQSLNEPTGAFHAISPGVAGLPDLTTLRRCFSQLAVGLGALHKQNLLHCDLKPANVLVTPEGRVVILDFGLITQQMKEPTTSHRIAGTPLYMAPELWLGESPDPASDWYSFGVVLYQALLGRLPHRGKIADLFASKLQNPVRSLRELNSAIPETLDQLCLGLLESEARYRPRFVEILERLDTSPQLADNNFRQRSPVFVGREHERTQLHNEFLLCLRGGSRVSFLHGETGLGKSALCEQFITELGAEGVFVLRGRCYEQESLSYKALDAVVDSLSELLYRLQPHGFGSVVGTRELIRLFPVLERSLVGTVTNRLTLHNPIEIKRRAQRALRSILVELGRVQPVLMWIDDVHWGDRDSATILFNTLQGLDAPRVMLLLTFRSDEIDQSPFLREFRRLQSEQPGAVPAKTISLSKFSVDDCHNLVAKILARDQPTSSRYIRRLVRETGGSPLLIDELVRFSRARAGDSIDLDGGSDEAVETFERNLRLSGLLSERINNLPEPARELLEVVCVAGVPLAFDLAHAAIGREPLEPRVVNRMRFNHLLRVQVLGDKQHFAPYHDRVRTFASASLSKTRRRSLHKQLALTLEGEPSTPARLLASHYYEARMLEPASHHAQRAAHAADVALAFDDAATLYAQALLWWPGDEKRHRLLRRKYADALVNSGRCGEAAPIYLELHQRADPKTARELKRLAAQAHMTCGNLDEGVELLKQCLADVGLSYPGSTRRAMFEIATSLVRLKFASKKIREHQSDQAIEPLTLEQIDTCFLASGNILLVSPIHSIAFSNRALRLAIASGTREQLVMGLYQVGCSLAMTERTDGQRLFEQADAFAKTMNSNRIEAFGSYWRGLLHYARGRWPESLEAFEQAYRGFAELPGATTELQKAEVNSILILQLLGDFRALSHRTEQALLSAQKTGNRYSEVMALMYSSVARLAGGDLKGAHTRIQNAVERAPVDTYLGFSQLKFEIWCALYAGDAQTAFERIERGWPTIQKSRMNALSTFRIVMRALRVGCILEYAVAYPEQQQRLYKLAQKTLRELDVDIHPGAQGPTAMLHAALAYQRGDRDRALSACERAIASYEQLQRPLDRAHALHRAGEILRDQTMCSEANKIMFARGVAKPLPWLRCQTPGFPHDT